MVVNQVTFFRLAHQMFSESPVQVCNDIAGNGVVFRNRKGETNAIIQ